MDIGAVVHNVGTVFAIREAVLFNKPLFERFVTVSGSMINNPGNYRVRIGTTLQNIIDDCGGLKGEPARIVIGGPMCGTAVYSTDVPVVKGTSAILFLAADEIDAEEYGPCLRCGNCVDVCPIRLLPCDIAAAVERNRPDIAEKYKPFDCILCGSCTFVCPAKRPVSHFVKLARKIIKK
jgi:electron transport complex protein RnfC